MSLTRRTAGALACAFAFAHGCTPSHAQEVAPTPVPTASRFDLGYEISPRQLEPAQFKTTVEVTRDAQVLHVHVVALDPEPAAIVAQQARFDAVPRSDDAIQLSVVPQDNGRRVYTFRVNAAGARADSIDSSSGEGAGDWNGEWTAKTTRDAKGYAVDLVIPFATLGLDATHIKGRTLRFNVTRRIGRGRGEILSVAAVDTRKPCEECQFTALPIASLALSTDTAPIARPTRLRLQPYVVATASQDYAGAPRVATTTQFDAGLDAQWFITPRDVLVATFNPDFAQVESDSIQFHINERFVPTLPERRSFFTNESGVFATPIELLYTRRIANPNRGLQYVRHRDSYDLGVLYADDATTNWIQPGVDGSSSVFLDRPSQNLVARAKARHGDFRYGAATTLRTADDYRDAVLAIDGEWDAGSRSVLTGQLAYSNACDPAATSLDGVARCTSDTALQFNHSYGGERWSNYSSASQTGKNFRADLGSIGQSGIRSASDYVGYQRQLKSKGLFERWTAQAGVQRTDSLQRGLLDQSLSGYLEAATAHATFGLNGSVEQEVLNGRRFAERDVSVSASHQPSGRIRYSVSAGRGIAIDYGGLRTGQTDHASVYVSLKPGSRFDMGFSVSAYRFTLPDRPLYWTVSTSLRGNLHLSERHHLSVFLNTGQSRVFFEPASLSSGNLTARYQLTYQYKPTAFRYLIAGVSGASTQPQEADRLRPRSAFGFIKYVHDFSW